MKVFITGGTGLLGRHVVAELLLQGFDVIALIRPENLAKKKLFIPLTPIQWVEGDVGDIAALEMGFKEADLAIHAAAIVSFDPRHRNKMLKINAEGTANVVNCALAAGRLQKLVHVSSVATFSPSKPLPAEVDERQGFNPDSNTSDYAISKHLAEMEAIRGVVEGLSVAMVNPSILLAPGGADESSASLIDYARKGHPFYPTGWINYVDVRDVSKIIVRLLTSGPTQGDRMIVNAGHVTYHQFLNEATEAFEADRPWIKAGRLMASLGWRADAIRSILTGKPRFLTRFTANAATNRISYHGATLSSFWPDFRFTPLSDSLQWIANSIK